MGWTNTGKRAKPERKPELVIPEGGKDGQVLVRTEKELEWAGLPIPEGGKPGQILVCTAHGVEWIDRVFSCTFSEADGTWTCDKTFNELKAAYEAGSELIAYVAGYTCRLSFCETASMIFSLFMTDALTFDHVYTLVYASISKDGSVTVDYEEL